MTQQATVLDKPEQISAYQASVVKRGLEACKIGLRLNRAYTPKNLFAMAEKITGKKFKRGQYDAAIAALHPFTMAGVTEAAEKAAAEQQ